MRAFLTVPLILALAGCSDKSDSDVSGRTRSLSSSYREAGASPNASLTLSRSREQATGSGTAALTATLVADAEQVLLRLPDESELPLELSAEGPWTARLEVPLENAEATFARGSYTLLWAEPDGTRRSLTFVAESGFPGYPLVTAPQDMALIDPAAVQTDWQWAGTAGLFDLAVEDAGPGTSVFSAQDVPGFTFTLPEALQGGTRYRLGLSAVSGPASNSVRWTSTSVVVFDTTTG